MKQFIQFGMFNTVLLYSNYNEFRYAYIPEWRILDSFHQMAQMSSINLDVPIPVEHLVLREPKGALVRAITTRIADMTKDIGAACSRQTYECTTVPKWTLDEVE